MAFRNNNYEEKEYIENLVALNRVSKTVKGVVLPVLPRSWSWATVTVMSA